MKQRQLIKEFKTRKKKFLEFINSVTRDEQINEYFKMYLNIGNKMISEEILKNLKTMDDFFTGYYPSSPKFGLDLLHVKTDEANTFLMIKNINSIIFSCNNYDKLYAALITSSCAYTKGLIKNFDDVYDFLFSIIRYDDKYFHEHSYITFTKIINSINENFYGDERNKLVNNPKKVVTLFEEKLNSSLMLDNPKIDNNKDNFVIKTSDENQNSFVDSFDLDLSERDFEFLQDIEEKIKSDHTKEKRAENAAIIDMALYEMKNFYATAPSVKDMNEDQLFCDSFYKGKFKVNENFEILLPNDDRSKAIGEINPDGTISRNEGFVKKTIKYIKAK